jgi:hypothetical protein
VGRNSNGDTTCSANQLFHSQAQDVNAILASSPERAAALYDQRSPQLWAKNIKVPVFIAGALQDEQTGPQWTDLLTALAQDPHVYATVQNGIHGDSLDASVLSRWIAFNDLYVAQTKPPTTLGLTADLITQGIDAGVGGSLAVPTPPTASDATYAKALKDFESHQPRILVNFDNGSSTAGPGVGQSAYSAGFSAWPPLPSATTYYLGTAGSLSTTPLGSTATTSFTPDASTRPVVTGANPGFDAWAAAPKYNWALLDASSSRAFIASAVPAGVNQTLIGPASLNVVVTPSADTDVDLQATVSVVRPDGSEIYLTSGWLRASYAATLQSSSTALHPVYSYDHATALTPGQPVALRIALDPVAYTLRPGDRLRVSVEAPGGDRPSWAFGTTKAVHGPVAITLGANATSLVSSLVVAQTTSVTPSNSEATCANGASSNRGQPCRTYVASGNGG